MSICYTPISNSFLNTNPRKIDTYISLCQYCNFIFVKSYIDFIILFLHKLNVFYLSSKPDSNNQAFFQSIVEGNCSWLDINKLADRTFDKLENNVNVTDTQEIQNIVYQLINNYNNSNDYISLKNRISSYTNISSFRVIKFIRYMILSKITFGKIKAKYKIKYKKMKKAYDNIKNFKDEFSL